MAKSLSRRDLEALSAYLDGQFSPRNIRKLESRLRHEPDLQRALEQLRQTRHALRSAPQARSPRSFTLTPEMAGRRVVIPRGYTAMRLVAVTASLMFAVVFVGELLLSGMPMAGVAFAPAAEKSVEESYAMQGLADEDVPAVAAPAESLERAVEVEEETVMAEVPAEEPEALGAAMPTITVEEKAGEGLDTAGWVGTPTMMGTPLPPSYAPAPVEEPVSTEIPPPIPTPTATIVEEAPRDLETGEAVNEIIEPGVDHDKEEGGVVDIPEERVRPGVQIPPIRLIEGGLILVALLSGGIAYFLRRRMQ
jgi:hypothetical protein